MSNSPYQVTVVTHTHWDREWYRPFQSFRLQLVTVIDKLLAMLDADPNYRAFLLDGQTIILGDYLDIRPEREADLRWYIEGGRLSIGPWHVLPDEFLVSPEATVRNLMLGAKICADFGRRMPIGYTPDPFGHIAQLPQILAGFGLEAAALQRGLAYEPNELWWEAPDGTRLFLLYFREGYGNLSWVPPSPQAFVRAVNRQLDLLAPHASTNNLLLLSGTDHMMPQPELPGLIDAANDLLEGRAHLQHGTLVEFLGDVRESLNSHDSELPVISGELRNPQRYNLLPGVLSTRMWIKQRNNASQVALERYAEPLSAFVRYLGGADRSGEVWRAWRYLIQNHPHDSICGCSIDQVHEEMRTRFDWTDQIADDVTVAALQGLAAHINTNAIPKSVGESPAHDGVSPLPSSWGKGLGDGGEEPTHAIVQGGGDVALLVYNPAQPVATGAVTVEVPWPGHGRTYELIDENGESVPVVWHSVNQKIDQQTTLDNAALMKFIDDIEVGFYGWRLVRDVRVWLAPDGKTARLEVVFPEYHTGQIGDFAALADQLRRDMQNVESCELTIYLAGFNELGFLARDVPGVGYKTYRLRNVAGDSSVAMPTEPRPLYTIENEYFVVSASPSDGTLTVTDKITGIAYSGLNTFEDIGDRGDEYNFDPLGSNVVNPEPAPYDITEIYTSNLGGFDSLLMVDARFTLPAELSVDRNSRVGETRMRVNTWVYLRSGVRVIEVMTEVSNPAKDHRLRVLFPTPIKSDVAIADSHFDRIQRKPFTDYNPADYNEQPQPTAPQRACVAVTDGIKGLMIANRGLPEYELIPGEDGATIALTLLRCVGWLSREDLTTRKGHAGPELETPGAQCIGDHTFEYSIIPFGDDLNAAADQAYAFEAPLRALAVPLSDGELPPSASLVNLEPNALVLTSVKPAESGEGFIVRFYNSAESAVSGRVTFGLPVREIAPTNLLEEPQAAPVPLDDSRAYPLDVPPKRIITLWVK